MAENLTVGTLEFRLRDAAGKPGSVTKIQLQAAGSGFVPLYGAGVVSRPDGTGQPMMVELDGLGVRKKPRGGKARVDLPRRMAMYLALQWHQATALGDPVASTLAMFVESEADGGIERRFLVDSQTMQAVLEEVGVDPRLLLTQGTGAGERMAFLVQRIYHGDQVTLPDGRECGRLWLAGWQWCYGESTAKHGKFRVLSPGCLLVPAPLPESGANVKPDSKV